MYGRVCVLRSPGSAQYVSPACYHLTTKSNLISQASTSTRLGASEWASRHFTEPMNGSTASMVDSCTTAGPDLVVERSQLDHFGSVSRLQGPGQDNDILRAWRFQDGTRVALAFMVPSHPIHSHPTSYLSCHPAIPLSHASRLFHNTSLAWHVTAGGDRSRGPIMPLPGDSPRTRLNPISI